MEISRGSFLTSRFRSTQPPNSEALKRFMFHPRTKVDWVTEAAVASGDAQLRQEFVALGPALPFYLYDSHGDPRTPANQTRQFPAVAMFGQQFFHTNNCGDVKTRTVLVA